MAAARSGIVTESFQTPSYHYTELKPVTVGRKSEMLLETRAVRLLKLKI